MCIRGEKRLRKEYFLCYNFLLSPKSSNEGNLLEVRQNVSFLAQLCSSGHLVSHISHYITHIISDWEQVWMIFLHSDCMGSQLVCVVVSCNLMFLPEMLQL